jgi:hypothetical protein
MLTMPLIMTEWIVTYSDDTKEYIRGYNLFMALGMASKGTDYIKFIERIWN